MSRSDPSPNDYQLAHDSLRDGFIVHDELSAEFPITEEELLWLSELFAAILSHSAKDNDLQ
ncbi:hypothetical protein [Erythrobacter sp. HI0063]|uniref:hypothetical protein n=1 Tax=Erythrobacter sp. HI0063 TaxID=1822240 RepID=UPI000B1B3DE9|nr:hypothetical protein [Erythrobacter sp. HI0063]